MSDLDIFKGNPLVGSDLFERMMETNKLLSGGGGGGKRISIKGGRFREIVNGEQIRVNSSGAMNVVIVKSSGVIRTYFEASYDPDNPSAPTCWSQDTEHPSADVPEGQRQAPDCRSCPMNVKGSGQGDSRACRYAARVAVCVEGDYDTVYQMQIPATSLFGDAKDNKMGMQAYARFLTANKAPMIAVVTQMYFDEDSETPKLFFKPVRPLTEEALNACVEQADSEDAERAVVLTVHQVDDPNVDQSAAESDEAPKSAPKAKDKPKAEAKPKAEPEAEPETEPKTEPAAEEVEEPKRVNKKAEPEADVSSLSNVLSAWDD